MKRKILSVICLMLAILPCLMLVACKKDNKIEGEFHVVSVSMTMMGQTTSLTKAEYDVLIEKGEKTPEEEQQLMMLSGFFEIGFNFKADGTVVGTMPGEEDMVGTYTLKGEDVSLTSEGETMSGKYIDGTITFSMEEEGISVTYVLARK